MTKRITAFILAMIFVLMLTPNFTYAMDSVPSSLTVVMEYDGSPLKGVNVAVCRVADAKVEKYDVVYEATQDFTGAEADFTDLTKQKNIALAAVLDVYASAHDITMSVKATDSAGKAAFAGLSAGLYLVAQRDGANSRYIIAPYLVAVPGAGASGDQWNHDVVSYPKTEPVRRENELISVSVYKIWKVQYDHPNNIIVQLFRNGQPYGSPVSLNAGNYWRHTWDSLDPDDTWTVDETSVPAGYTKTISGNVNTGFIITNTKAPDTPPPAPPAQPGAPEPRTGDTSNIPLWIILSITSSIGLLLIVNKVRATGRLLSKPRSM